MADEERREGETKEGERDEQTGGDTGVKEEGDITGATSTHSGAGGQFGNTGGTGTAPG
jgi:hypothetical protein